MQYLISYYFSWALKVLLTHGAESTVPTCWSMEAPKIIMLTSLAPLHFIIEE